MPNKPSLALISLGCDKNLVESERILGALSNGVFIVSDVNAADIVIINTCGFIQAAVDEAHEQINEVLNQRKLNAHVIVTGCFVQRFLHDLPPQYPDIHAFVADFAEVQKAVADLVGGTWNEGQWRVLSTPSHYAYLKIAEGCDNCCTYCTIPLIKGGLKSVPMDELLSEAAALAATGVKELILIAQDTAVYGRDIYGESRLPHLLQELAKIPAIKWLRLMYCYPEHISDGLVEEIAANPKVCKYLDMPIQHSSSSVLDRMGRKMDESGLRGLITRLRTRIPGIALRTTVITGFPGET
ncbi:MAG: MiaB/RimO family radical SAM methylthiotransferase, partial [Defluviitaleaceae bacterium]|nr:MiaB/RimO family radical SAM methylthiotransferase [Defluviitaleaceae bacterium]